MRGTEPATVKDPNIEARLTHNPDWALEQGIRAVGDSLEGTFPLPNNVDPGRAFSESEREKLHQVLEGGSSPDSVLTDVLDEAVFDINETIEADDSVHKAAENGVLPFRYGIHRRSEALTNLTPRDSSRSIAARRAWLWDDRPGIPRPQWESSV